MKESRNASVERVIPWAVMIRTRMPGYQRSFSREFDDEFAVGADGASRAYVGRDVLRGLVRGIDDFILERQDRWGHRLLGPVLLGSANWINDPELIAKLKELTAACVVVTKKGRDKWDMKKLQELHLASADAPGLPIQAFPDLVELAPRVDDKPRLVGPYDRREDLVLPTIRTIGFRPQTRSDFPPWIHAKLALLGELWWHDEGPVGPEEIIGFRPAKLWVSSANFTRSSRSSLEVGYWTDDRRLVEGIERFLVKLIGASEGLDPDDAFKPQLLPVEYDDDAFAEAIAEVKWEEDDDDEDEDY